MEVTWQDILRKKNAELVIAKGRRNELSEILGRCFFNKVVFVAFTELINELKKESGYHAKCDIDAAGLVGRLTVEENGEFRYAYELRGIFDNYNNYKIVPFSFETPGNAVQFAPIYEGGWANVEQRHGFDMLAEADVISSFTRLYSPAVLVNGLVVTVDDLEIRHWIHETELGEIPF